jgi:hypothetical protein
VKGAQTGQLVLCNVNKASSATADAQRNT